MKIAIPLEKEKMCSHFGHCRNFAIIETDEKGDIVARNDFPSPPHEPGLLPKWLIEREVNLVIVGGIGARAQGLLVEKGIDVIIGAQEDTPENLVKSYIDGKLSSGNNFCNH
ncbi:MAG: NifB/NifX family molybdenum-iron cluster-binding protein [Alphaproteobacteria bacterium]|nr:NifB/NifX family molybdenum-iron cluster-binding protein [Alphaproteobacteria bacterium]